MTSRTLKRKLWINLGLTALVGGLVILVMLEPGQEPATPSVSITNLAPADINSVVIDQPDRSTIRLERGEAGWRMTAPRNLRAAGEKIDDLLAVAQAESHQRYAAGDMDPAELGLDEPEATLALDDTRLVFGDTDPIDGRRYVRVDDTIHMIAGRHLARIRNEPFYWVDNALLPDDASLTALDLPDLRLRRDADGLWHADPEPEGVSADALVNLVDAWRNATALAVQAAGDPPADTATIRLHLKERNEPIVFEMVDNRAGFELIRQDIGLRYTMTEPQRAELLQLSPPEPATEGGATADGGN